MHARQIVALLLLAACTSSTEPKGSGIPAVVGAWCASTTPVVRTASDGSVWVDLSLNTTTYQDVRRSDGVVIRQQVKGCRHYSCAFPPTFGTQQQMISACQDLAAQST